MIYFKFYAILGDIINTHLIKNLKNVPIYYLKLILSLLTNTLPLERSLRILMEGAWVTQYVPSIVMLIYIRVIVILTILYIIKMKVLH